MVFGLPERFAVESIVYDPLPKSPLGHLRLWIGGQPVGEFNQNVALETPVQFIRDFLALPGPHNHSSLAGKTNEEVLLIVHWARYSDGVCSAEEQEYVQYRHFADAYSGCELCPALSPSFDGEQAILLEEEGRDRIIWKSFGEHHTQEVVLHEGECLSSLKSFVDWIGCGDGTV